MIEWQSIDPKDAVNIDLSVRLDITAPLNEMGERCPWPWDPQQLVDAPIGIYHCPYCLSMVVAGIPHLDYSLAPEEDPATSDPARAERDAHPPGPGSPLPGG